MKHTFRISLALATLAALTFAGCSVTSHTETAKGVDFSQYKTFAWSGTPIEKRINGTTTSSTTILKMQ